MPILILVMIDMSSAKLIAVTKPLDGFEFNTAEELISYCARVSNPANATNFDTAPKLLRYLINHKHCSPFEMVSATMEINTTRDIARQILRHRSFSFQEFSQRYADPTLTLGFSVKEARLQDAHNRQNSIEVDDPALQQRWYDQQIVALTSAQQAYKWAVENGIAKEVARSVLPEGLTNSRLFMGGTLRSWIHYCDLRRGNGTQLEHQIIANQCWAELKTQFKFLEILDQKEQ